MTATRFQFEGKVPQSCSEEFTGVNLSNRCTIAKDKKSYRSLGIHICIIKLTKCFSIALMIKKSYGSKYIKKQISSFRILKFCALYLFNV